MGRELSKMTLFLHEIYQTRKLTCNIASIFHLFLAPPKLVKDLDLHTW